jgi:hypothetical protein
MLSLRRLTSFVGLLVAGFLLAADARPACAARPDAPHLLPDTTLAFVRVASVPDLIEKFKQTALGRMFRDEALNPLVKQLYGSAAEALGKVQDRIGAGLDDLLAIPQGELCVALVWPKEGQAAVVALIEAGDRLPVAMKVIERGEQEMAKQGATKSIEAVGATKLVLNQLPGERARRLAYFQRDGVLVITTDAGVAKGVLAAWDGGKAPTLADSSKFSSIMSRCGASGGGDPPQITFFVDPIELIKQNLRGSAAATFLALLPVLGVDGIQGVGGGVTMNTPDFDSVIHLHLLLDSARNGVLAMLALSTGDMEPEPWVPSDVTAYRTVYWDFQKSYTALGPVYNGFRGQDALANDVKRNISDPLGVDFEKEFIRALDGRLTWVSWMVKPARLNSQANLVAVKLKDAKAFQAAFDQVMAKFPNALQKATFGSATYYHAPDAMGPRKPQPDSLIRRPDPCLAILGDYLMVTDSSEFLHHVIVTQSGGLPALAGELDYKLMASRIRRQPGGDKPGLIMFARPEQALRQMYDLATAEDVRKRLTRQAENNQFFRAIDGALQKNPLPPFSTLEKYLAPAGGLMTNDESGLHYMGFALKRK